MFLSVSPSRKVLGVFPSVCFTGKMFGVFLSLNASVCLSACLPVSLPLKEDAVGVTVFFRLPQSRYLMCFRLRVCLLLKLNV